MSFFTDNEIRTEEAYLEDATTKQYVRIRLEPVSYPEVEATRAIVEYGTVGSACKTPIVRKCYLRQTLVDFCNKMVDEHIRRGYRPLKAIAGGEVIYDVADPV